MKVLILFCIAFFFPLHGFAKLCFIHIAKTGGTTMHALLQQHFGEGNIYPYRGIREIYPYKGVNESVTILEAISGLSDRPLSSQSIISGHFPLWWLQKKGLDPSTFCFTILRDPIERVLSQYFFKIKVEYPYFKYPEQSPLDIFPNVMCRMLCSDPRLNGQELLENALQNLENLDFIIFADDFEGGSRRLFTKMNSEHKGMIPKLNETSRGFAFTEEMIQQIREMNAWDLKLYEYATTHLRKKSY